MLGVALMGLDWESKVRETRRGGEGVRKQREEERQHERDREEGGK